MASLTPGTLSKLLQNIHNSDFKVAGDHRSALLQVIGIVPSLAGAGDLWNSKGFYLRVSDSLHSAYLSVSESDVDLVLSDKIQLGQFIHVTRIDSGSPVPVLRGLKPVPKRRECIGDPKDLISSDSLVKSVRKENVKQQKVKTVEVNLRRISLGNVKNEGLEPRRLSLDSARRGWDRSPAPKNGRLGSSDSASVVSGKRASSEKNLKMKSPSSGAASLKQHISGRKSLSEKDLTLKPPSPRISPLNHGLLYKKSLSEKDTTPKHSSSGTSPCTQVKSDRKHLSEKESTTKHLILNVSPLKNKNAVDSPKLVSKPIVKDLKPSIIDGTIPSHLIKFPLSFKTWSDAKTSWNSLPSTIRDLGKEVMSHRNAGFLAAVHAIEETSATECVLHCLRIFAELCESSEKDSAFPLVEEFLNLHQSMQRAATVVSLLLDTMFPKEYSIYCSSQCSLSELCKKYSDKNAISWVQAAVETNLSKFGLFTKEEKRGSLSGEKCYYVVLENCAKKAELENHSPDKKRSPRNQRATVSGSSLKTAPAPAPYQSRQCHSTTKKEQAERDVWSKGDGLTVAASLAEKLLLVSRAWFLNYLEASLDKGFGLRKGESDSEIACLLGQLKRVNQWLDDSTPDGTEASDERIEGLKKKIFGFLLNNVDSAVSQTGS